MSVRVSLVIAAFRGDDSVLRLLEQANAITDPPWAGICVIDSLGSGKIAEHIHQRGWKNVDYQSHPENLGSAGNLCVRLQWSAAHGYDFAYALNQDGKLDPEAVRGLVAAAARRPQTKLGAIYPLRRYVNRGSRYDLTGVRRLPVPFQGTSRRPTTPFRVHWASSNGALYSMRPTREGLLPWADFWMGWEDLAYGWLLDDHHYEQWVETSVVFDDEYETREVVQGITVTEKPTWYAYYQMRNLLLASRRTEQSLASRGVLVARVAMECGLTLAFRNQKRERLKLLTAGIRDGLRGVSGKGPVP